MTEFAPESEYAPQPQDDFESSVAAPTGFAGRHWRYQYEVAGGPIVTSDQMPLPPSEAITRQEQIDLDCTLRISDTESSLYAARRHRYLGVTVVTVGVFIGTPGSGRVRQEHFAPGDDKFITFAVDCLESSLPILTTAGRMVIENLAEKAMDDVVAMLEKTHGL